MAYPARQEERKTAYAGISTLVLSVVLFVVSSTTSWAEHPADPGGRPRGLALTQREIEVISLAAEGRTNREIAGLLGISPLTVRKHLEHAYPKLGVGNRTAAAARLR